MVLCIGFWTPIGRERLGGTAYQRFDNLLVNFMDVEVSSAATAGVPTSAWAGEPASTPPRAPRRTPKPRQAKEALPSAPSAPEPEVHISSTPSPIQGIPEPAAARPDGPIPLESYSADLIREAFEAEASKLFFDGRASGDKVLLRVVGICRWQGRYIARVAVTNRTGEDFFIKELSAYAGPDYITLKSYFRLFVEPSRTREGHVVFEAKAGAKVKITLKEDRERGRVIDVPVQYPF